MCHAPFIRRSVVLPSPHTVDGYSRIPLKKNRSPAITCDAVKLIAKSPATKKLTFMTPPSVLSRSSDGRRSGGRRGGNRHRVLATIRHNRSDNAEPHNHSGGIDEPRVPEQPEDDQVQDD